MADIDYTKSGVSPSPADIRNSLKYQLGRLHDSDRLNILVPAGAGDLYWLLAKLHPLIRERKAMVWFPFDEQRRAHDVIEMSGLHDYDYLLGLTTNFIWGRDGQPEIPSRGWVSCHANGHLEAGLRIEDWYPDLPLHYPKLRFDREPPRTDKTILLFTGQRRYFQQNLPAFVWRSMADRMQSAGYTVRFVAAADDTEFVGEIWPQGDNIINQPLSAVLAAATAPHCAGMVGVASGPLICAGIAGARVLLGYPSHLPEMPGSWEPPGSNNIHSCRLGELERKMGEIFL